MFDRFLHYRHHDDSARQALDSQIAVAVYRLGEGLCVGCAVELRRSPEAEALRSAECPQCGFRYGPLNPTILALLDYSACHPAFALTPQEPK